MEERNPNHPGEMSTDASVAERNRHREELNTRKLAVQVLQQAGVPFLVGGMYAFAAFTGIYRDTKDLDVHVKPEDAERALRAFEAAGWQTEHHDEGWLYKAFRGDYFVDIIFCSGNGVAEVDDEWFAHARERELFGERCLVAPAEEQMWMRAFVNERERFDGADFNHLLLRTGPQIDWPRLMRRFERHWELLLGHLMMFRFAYPSETHLIPDKVMRELLFRTLESMKAGPRPEKVCRGALISQAMYTVDVAEWGFIDGREWDRKEREGERERNAQSAATPPVTH
ncbi:MAG TPA: nucleotidyltransferase family protein [Myxococcaceae bacterium]|nr:nucleotidyltransferase family protein [Myxococcaceae bacterium]